MAAFIKIGLFLLAATLGFVGVLWGLGLAFKRSLGWGLVALLLAPAGVIAFLVMTWRENYKPLCLLIGGLVLGLATALIAQA